MKIAVGLNTFLEKDNLEITLTQLSGFDTVIAVDGKYPHFEYPSRYSDDGSLDVLWKYHENTVTLVYSDTQIEKRNAYLNYAKVFGYDFLLVVDADFDVKVDWKTLREELKKLKDDNYLAYNVTFRVSTDIWPFALLYKPDRIEYHDIHHLLRCRRCHMEIDITKQHTDNVKGIEISHRVSHRSEEYEVAKVNYQTWKLDIENNHRRQRGMKEIRMYSV